MIPRVRKGDLIEADVINQLIDAVNAFSIRAAAPLQVSKAVGGGIVISLGFGYDEWCVFELTSDLEDDAGVRMADAKIIWCEEQDGLWDVDADTEEITDHAATNMTGTTGQRGIAKFDRQSGLWLIVDKDC